MTRSLRSWVAVVVGAVLTFGTALAVAAPTAAAPVPTSVVQVAAGGRHTCALTASGEVWCWGANDRGQLGRDDLTSSAAPVLVESLTGVTGISAGGAHTCALTTQGAVWCWGANGSGQLGDGTTEDRYAPTRTLVSGVSSISAGRLHTCAMAANGSNEVQSLRVDASGGSFTVRVDGASNTLAWNASARAVATALQALTGSSVSVWATGLVGTYAIAFDGGTRAHQDIPTLEVDGSHLKGPGATASVTVVTDGGARVLCWGSDGSGQLGRGDIADAALTLGGLDPSSPADARGANSIAVDPQSGDFLLSDSRSNQVWRFTGAGRFAGVMRDLGYEPGAIGTAQVFDTERQQVRSKVYVVDAAGSFGDTTHTPGSVIRYDVGAGTEDLVTSQTQAPTKVEYDPLSDPHVVPPTWECACATTAMAVDPDSGAVFLVVSGQGGPQGDVSDFDKLVRVSSDLRTTEQVVDLHADYPGLTPVDASKPAITDLAVGKDEAGATVLYALQQPVAGGQSKVGIWDTASTDLALRASFLVDPLQRGSADGAYRGACPARQVTDPTEVTLPLLFKPSVWLRTVRTGEYDVHRLGPATNGDVGVVTQYRYSSQGQVYVKQDDQSHFLPADLTQGDGSWVDTSAISSDPAFQPTLSPSLDACVEEYAAGSQGSYGGFVASYRGDGADGTDLGVGPSDLATTLDGRLLVVDPEHHRVQQFSALGEAQTQWPGDQYSTVPVASHALDWSLQSTSSQVVGVSAGDAHTCVATTESTIQPLGPVLCWGSDSAGQLGYAGDRQKIPFLAPADNDDRTSFPVIGPDQGSVSAGGQHTCSSDGLPWQDPPFDGAHLSCWGADDQGQLAGPAPAQEDDAVTSAVANRLVAAGGTATCMDDLGQHAVTCHGPDAIEVTGLSDSGLTSLSVGGRHACAAIHGAVQCWGADDWGQLGPDGTAGGGPEAVPVPISPRVSVQGPTSLDAPIEVRFEDATSGVSPGSFDVEDGGGSAVAISVRCADPSGVATSCSTGQVRTAFLSPKGRVVAGEIYSITVDPAHDLVAGGFEVTSPSPTPTVQVPSALDEDQLGAAAYTWGSARAPSAWGRSYVAESAKGASASWRFQGSAVTWYTVRGPGEGLATVSIDGGKPHRVDNSAATARYRVARTFGHLGAGAHTVRITVLGMRGAHGVGTAVAVDALRAGGRLARSPALTTTWGSARLGAARYAGASFQGSAVSFRFRGSQLVWSTVQGRGQGVADVFIDGKRIRRVDNRGPSAPRLRTRVLHAPQNSSGVHEVRIVVVGSKPHHVVSVDGFEVS